MAAEDYVPKDKNDNDRALINIDYCKKATCNELRTYRKNVLSELKWGYSPDFIRSEVGEPT